MSYYNYNNNNNIKIHFLQLLVTFKKFHFFFEEFLFCHVMDDKWTINAKIIKNKTLAIRLKKYILAAIFM